MLRVGPIWQRSWQQLANFVGTIEKLASGPSDGAATNGRVSSAARDDKKGAAASLKAARPRLDPMPPKPLVGAVFILGAVLQRAAFAR